MEAFAMKLRGVYLVRSVAWGDPRDFRVEIYGSRGNYRVSLCEWLFVRLFAGARDTGDADDTCVWADASDMLPRALRDSIAADTEHAALCCIMSALDEASEKQTGQPFIAARELRRLGGAEA